MKTESEIKVEEKPCLPSDYGDNATPCPECSATGQHYLSCSKHEE